MNISDAADLSGLPAKTIRYYEDIRLLKPPRDANGYRAFRESDVHKLTFLARARALGFSIDECRTLLGLWGDQDRASSDVRALALAHLDQIETKITDLQTMHQTLSELVQACAGDHRPDCPILNSLGTETTRS
jgi:MerR family copper efflux transcriptional regulator